MNPLRRAIVVLVAAGALAGCTGGEKPVVEVWKSATCGCCKDWIRHLQANGFEVRAHDVAEPGRLREKLGIADRYGSCHTAQVGGYALEGHVPAAEIQRLLRERPAALGLAVPAMPLGSPGMDGPEYGGRKDPYDVLLLERGGEAHVYHAYR